MLWDEPKIFFLERRYFFSIILSEFLKNRVALHLSPDEMLPILRDKIRGAQIRRMVVTMGAQGAVFATLDGEDGYCPAKKVDVKDTTGAGDAFFAGAVIGQTYGKTMMESCEIGTRLAASVITTGENVCPRYLPSEFGLDVSTVDDAQIALEF